jgi:hypothetical protein
MAVKKTRFVSTVDDVDREIFCITERKNGNLMISLKYAGATALVSDGALTRQDKFSIYSSPASPRITFKQQYRLEDNVLCENAALVLPGPEGLIWPAFMYAPPDPRIPGYECKSKKGDTIVSVTRYDPKGVKLIICPIIVGKYVADLVLQGFHTQRHYFTSFDVVIARAFMVGATYAFGEKALFIGSAETDDKRVLSSRTEGDFVSYGSADLTRQMDAGIYSIREQYLNQVRKLFNLTVEKDAALISEMERVTDHFGINPPPVD